MNWRLAILFIYLSGFHSYRLEAQYWSTLGGGFGFGGGGISPVFSLAVHNNELYAGGYFGSADMIQANCIAKWDGARWKALGSGLNGAVYAMVVYNGELYAGGVFGFTGSTISVARWNGSTWSAVGTGFSASSWFEIRTLAVYNGELYAGGSFETADGVLANNIAKWNGSNWLPVGAGTNNGVRALVVHNGALYAGGSFDTAGGLPAYHIAKWDGTNWSSLGTGTNGPVNALIVYRDTLQVAGKFSQAGGKPASNIAKWDGGSWSSLRGGLMSNWGEGVMALGVYNDYLYAGGDIDFAAGIPVNNIAKWNSDTWSSVRQGTGASVQALVSAHSSLYVGGWFPHVDGGLPAYNIARWKENCSNPPPLQPGHITGNMVVCPSTPETYFINPVNNATHYTWTLPEGWQGNSTSTSLTITIPPLPPIPPPPNANYPISVVAHNDCGGSYFSYLDLSYFEQYDSMIGINGPAAVCEGATRLYYFPRPASSYNWTLPPGWAGSSDSSSILVTVGPNSGTISLDIIYDCGYTLHREKDVNTNPLPQQPGPISGTNQVRTGQTTSYTIDPVAGATSYNWVLPTGGLITTGLNSRFVTINWVSAGVHQLSVRAVNACGESIDQVLQVTVSPLTPVSSVQNPLEVYISPNPSAGEFHLRVLGGQEKWIHTDIFNMAGQVVYRSQQKSGTNDYTQLIDLSAKSRGLYRLRITIGKKVFFRTFAKIK